MAPFFTVENLKFTNYASSFDLDVEKIKINKGGFFSIIGPNGAGKSTFLKILSGEIRGYSGKIILKGKDMGKIPLNELAKSISYLPQEIEGKAGFSVYDVVLMGRYPYMYKNFFHSKEDHALVKESLGKTGVANLASREFSTLSGGEKKKVLIASVLAQETEILLLDEPSASLDMKAEAELFSLLKKLSLIEGKTVMVATHNINLASIFSDRISLFKSGEILKTGKPDEVINEEYLKLSYGEGLSIGDHPYEKDRKIVFPMTRVRGEI